MNFSKFPKPRSVAVFFIIGIFTIAFFVALVFAIINTSSASYIRSILVVPKAHTAIVLGAAIMNDGSLSEIFKDRLDIGLELYQKGKVINILITGDDGSKTHNEVNPARLYLIANNVPSEDIFLDHAGFDTYSSMYRAKEVFYIGSATICTQSFHLPRSVFIARRLGIDAYGVAADQHPHVLSNSVREIFANVKAVLNLLYDREPKYLGEPIPVTGDSAPSI